MSKQTVGEVIRRAISDAAFRRQLSTDPKSALRGFNLSPEESAAITSGDPAKLGAFGVDQRMSKAFTAFGPISESGANVITDGSADSGSRAIWDQSSGRTADTSPLVDEGASAESALIADTSGGLTGPGGAYITSGETSADSGVTTGAEGVDSAAAAASGDEWTTGVFLSDSELASRSGAVSGDPDAQTNEAQTASGATGDEAVSSDSEARIDADPDVHPTA